MKVRELLSILSQDGIDPESEAMLFVEDEDHFIDLVLESVTQDDEVPVCYMQFSLFEDQGVEVEGFE